MDSYVVTILPGGRITIPAAIRRQLDLHPGETLIWRKQDGEIHLRKAEPDELVSGDEDTNSMHLTESNIDSEPQRGAE